MPFTFAAESVSHVIEYMMMPSRRLRCVLSTIGRRMFLTCHFSRLFTMPIGVAR